MLARVALCLIIAIVALAAFTASAADTADTGQTLFVLCVTFFVTTLMPGSFRSRAKSTPGLINVIGVAR